MKASIPLLLQAVASLAAAKSLHAEIAAMKEIVANSGYPFRKTAAVSYGFDRETNTAQLPPTIQKLAPVYNSANQRVKVRYGPYNIPSVAEKNLESTILDVSGMADAVKVKVTKPCEHCIIQFANAGLEYEDGTDANVDTGSWLHHIVLLTTGPGRKDAACGMPGFDPWFSNGNERELKAYASQKPGGQKSGYELKTTDSLTLYSELMNLDPKPKKVYITIYYEFVDPAPGYWDTKAVWLQFRQCGKSDIAPVNLDWKSRPLKQEFTETTATWTSPYNGEMVFVSGHLHDGGANTEVYMNDNLLCNSVTEYGTNKNYVSKSDSAAKGMDMGLTMHISNVTGCNDMGPIKSGDKYNIKVKYDFEKHPGMKNNKGQLDEVMGIAIMYIALPKAA